MCCKKIQDPKVRNWRFQRGHSRGRFPWLILSWLLSPPALSLCRCVEIMCPHITCVQMERHCYTYIEMNKWWTQLRQTVMLASGNTALTVSWPITCVQLCIIFKWLPHASFYWVIRVTPVLLYKSKRRVMESMRKKMVPFLRSWGSWGITACSDRRWRTEAGPPEKWSKLRPKEIQVHCGGPRTKPMEQKHFFFLPHNCKGLT